MEGAAPLRLTAIEEALLAISNAFFSSYPLIIAPIKKPVNVSPAAVVSTTGTSKIGCFISVSLYL